MSGHYIKEYNKDQQVQYNQGFLFSLKDSQPELFVYLNAYRGPLDSIFFQLLEVLTDEDWVRPGVLNFVSMNTGYRLRPENGSWTLLRLFLVDDWYENFL